MQTQTPIDWPAVHAEALEVFIRYLQIPSVNPPGDEAPAARYLGSLIEAAGIPVQYLETALNREIVYARLSRNDERGMMNDEQGKGAIHHSSFRVHH